MKPNNLLPITISELSRLYSSKKLGVEEVVKTHLLQAQTTNPHTHAYITITDQVALTQAKLAQKLIDSHTATPLTGIPFSMKDAYLTQHIPTTSASKVLDGYLPQYSATVYQKMLAAGSVLIGKNNQDAWGHGGSSENTDYQSVRNPWDFTRTAGGSSGGSAVALATNTVIAAIGEDTGGSIRNPASFNNICGLKVTYGRVSRYGAIAYASSLDTVGPMARTVEDLSYILEAIAGFDPSDASSSHEPVPSYSQLLTQPIKGKKIGLLKEYFEDGIDPQIKTIIQTAATQFTNLGAEIVEVSLPIVKHGVSIYYVIALSETSSNLARYDSIRYGHTRDLFTPETKRRILTGTFSLSSGYYDAYYKSALKARTQLIQAFTNTFNQVDVILAPVMPFPAYKLGEPPIGNNAITAMYLADLYTCATNPVGIPSLAIPAGFTSTGLPVGMQLMGPMFSEASLLQFGHHYQQVTNWHKKQPNLNHRSKINNQNDKKLKITPDPNV